MVVVRRSRMVETVDGMNFMIYDAKKNLLGEGMGVVVLK